jgi:lysophospholipase L1-like esterase
VLNISFIKALIASSIFFVMSCNADQLSKPQVLIIGDSISLGYTPYVRKVLDSKAVVTHSPGNSQDSTNGVRNLQRWIGSTKWDVISFNFGLWDICYRQPGSITKDHKDKVNGSIAVPLDQYERNLDLIASQLKAAGANVIFQSITVVPSQDPCRNSVDVEKYNQTAAKVMKRLNIPVNDLQGVSASLPDDMRESNTDVHYTKPGYLELAKSVAKSIEHAL